MPETAELLQTPPAPPRARPAPVALTDEERSILDHTVHRAAGQRYCGDSPAMQRLVALGLMRSLGFWSLCPDEYFTITAAGQRVLLGEQVLCLFVMYDRPDGFAESFVCRAWHVVAGEAVLGEAIAVAPTLEAARAKLPAGLSRLPRIASDDAEIVETWL